MSTISSIFLIIFVVLSQNIHFGSSSCNEAVCASIVSKCMLTQSCKCDLKNCTCCRDCYNCLDNLYDVCCSCVEMCPKTNYSEVPLSKNSHVGDLQDNIPELFNALTEEPDAQLRWVAYNFPVSFITPSDDKQWKLVAVSTGQDVSTMDDEYLNCTVAFMSQCTSWNKCKDSCRSMGAASYRWFHDGCCECVGDTCVNYGINVSKCSKCSSDRTDIHDDLDDASKDLSEIGSNETGDEALTSEAEEIVSSGNDAEVTVDSKSVYNEEIE